MDILGSGIGEMVMNMWEEIFVFCIFLGILFECIIMKMYGFYNNGF